MLKTALRATASVIAMAGAVTGISPVAAQSTGSQVAALEEIVVTARKREESLMEVPLAIAAVSGTDIQSAGIKDLQTLSLYTPGLWAENGVSQASILARQLTFRGLSVSTGQLFVDGAPYAGTGNPSLGDVERVEVLVGPQSAYFGRSTFEGAVNFVTKAPSERFAGRITAEYGKYDLTDDQLTLEGPIVPGKLSARVTGRFYKDGGQWTNSANPGGARLGSNDSKSAAATIYATPTDNLKIKVLLDYELQDSGPFKSIAFIGNNPKQQQQLFCNLGGTFGPYWCGALPQADNIPNNPGNIVISTNNVITPYLYNLLIGNSLNVPTLFDRQFKTSVGGKQEVLMGHLNLDYETESGWDLNSITALHKTRSQAIDSQDYRDNSFVTNPLYRGAATPNILPYIGFELLQQNILYDGSEEIRITSPQKSRLRGMAGANWLYTRTPGSTNYGQEPSTAAFLNSQTRQVTSTPAIFGGLYYDLVDDLTLGAEARYQWDKIEAQAKYPLNLLPAPLLSSTFKSFSPRVTLDYKYAPGSVAYALWSRGYRPGGFNTQLVGQPASVLSQLAATGAGITYLQEKLDNFEAGVKSTWLDGRLRTRIDGYYDLWRNGQVPNTLSYNAPNGVVVNTTLTTNVGAVNLYGVEFEGDMAVTKQLTVTANIDYQTSKIKQYVYVPEGPHIYGSTNVNGHKFQGAPDWTWTVSPVYTAHLAGEWDWYGRFDWTHRGRYYIDPTNVAWIPPANVTNLRLGIKDQTKYLEFYINNISNDLTFLSGVKGNDSTSSVGAAVVNEIRLVLPNKRTFGVKASYAF